MTKRGWQNANDNIGTRGNKFTMFSYILSCKIGPREFIDRNIFYADYEKSEIKKKSTKRLWSRNSNYSDSVFYHIEGLRLITSQKISSAENQHFQNKWNTSTVTDRLYTHRTLVDKFAGHAECSHVQKTVHNTCAKVSVASGLHKGHKGHKGRLNFGLIFISRNLC